MPSLFGDHLLLWLILFDDELELGTGSWGVRAGGETTVALAVGGIGEVATDVLSVAVVGAPVVGLAGDLLGLRGSSTVMPFVESFELPGDLRWP